MLRFHAGMLEAVHCLLLNVHHVDVSGSQSVACCNARYFDVVLLPALHHAFLTIAKGDGLQHKKCGLACRHPTELPRDDELRRPSPCPSPRAASPYTAVTLYGFPLLKAQLDHLEGMVESLANESKTDEER